MQVSAIQNQLSNSTRGMQAKKMPHSIGVTKGLTTDSFSSENNVSFTGLSGKINGAGVGALVGGVVGLALTVATAGTAIPFLAAYFAGLAGTAALGAKIGDKLEGPDKDDKK